MVIIELIMDFAGNARPFVEDASYLRLREIGYITQYLKKI
jgi:hypothetical protein